jgi:monofunctional biosynthetic peptidoglycan transglycosylase
VKLKIYLFLILIVVMFISVFWILYSDLPDDKTILNYIPETTVYELKDFDWDQEIVAPVRKFIPLKRISEELRKAVVVSEDDLFFQHSGINMKELKKAFQENLEKKRFARGASTITMQLARNAFLFKKKTIIRKLKEIVITKRIERLLDKRTILEYYLNVVEWGPNIYGAEAAAFYYYNKPAAKLNLAESSLLAAILPNPIYYNPFINLNGARRKQARVLKLMSDAHLISYVTMRQIKNKPIHLRGPKQDDEKQIFGIDLFNFDSLLKNPRFPQNLKTNADSTGIIYLPEGEK